jgi:outer membrane protein assembly factor BamE (lipoprotein component of BamABCDE complex)
MKMGEKLFHDKKTSGTKTPAKIKIMAVAATLAASLMLPACTTKQVLSNGPVIDDQQLALVPVGSSRDQVLLSLGAPSTTGTFDNEVFYYISQKRSRSLAFQKLRVIDQRILAIYFDENQVVTQVANYGLQDGKVFDFISRTTPTGGKDQTLIGRLLSGGGKPATPSIPTPGASSF